MKIVKLLRTLSLSLLSLLGISCASESAIPTAKNVDIKRYMGTWYEIARYENSFQKGLKNSSAQYILNADGTVTVVNSGEDANGKRTSAKGRAYAPDKGDFSKLRVSFFWPFYGDYYILDIDDKYSWVLVGGRDKSYLWILSRTPTLPQSTIAKILKIAEARGYDTGKLVFNPGSIKDEK